ncbi:MAG: hypothetical protein WAW11_00330 [Patescibacteria group bacterium]
MPKFDQTPVFDRAEDLNNEDFIEANRKKFKTAEDVVDESDDFTNHLDSQEEAMKNYEPADNQKELEKVRKDIGYYEYKGPDLESTPLASFHVDHDNEEVIAVAEEGLEPVKATDPEAIEDAPLEEEFAEANIAADSKVNFHMVENARKEYRDKESGSSDNLKTMPDNKIQRNNRGLIRKFLDNVWNKN